MVRRSARGFTLNSATFMLSGRRLPIAGSGERILGGDHVCDPGAVRARGAAGDSPWISGPESQQLVHRWRAESDAIAAGIGTVLADDPLLTARPGPSGAPFVPMGSKRRTGTPRQPLRVVFDRQARLPLDSQLLDTLDMSPVLVVC